MLVELQAEKKIRIMRLNNGENRFNREFVDAINHALDEVENDKAARALVVTSYHRKIFSNGLDLNWIVNLPFEDIEPFLIYFDRMLHRVFTYPKPMVAAMNGHAFAGGLFLALCADWRVMREDRGWCCVSEIDLGIDLPPGNAALVVHTVGFRRAEDLALTGRRLTAREALEVGLIDQVAGEKDVLPRAMAKAEELSAKNTELYARHKRTIRMEPARLLFEEDPKFISNMLKRNVDRRRSGAG